MPFREQVSTGKRWIGLEMGKISVDLGLSLEELSGNIMARPMINGEKATEQQMREMISFSEILSKSFLEQRDTVKPEQVFRLVLAACKWSCMKYANGDKPFNV